MTISPAAVAALAKGDLDNFVVAATPGGIEAQEAAGQAMLCASEQLPKEVRGATREQLEALGFKFGDDVDELFVTCTLPPGWKKQATGHSMHSDLLDDKGRRRAGIFYKAAFYDRRADMRMEPRYYISVHEDGSDADHYRTVIKDGNRIICELAESDARKWGAREELVKHGTAWLEERFPNFRDPLAYWD